MAVKTGTVKILIDDCKSFSESKAGISVSLEGTSSGVKRQGSKCQETTKQNKQSKSKKEQNILTGRQFPTAWIVARVAVCKMQVLKESGLKKTFRFQPTFSAGNTGLRMSVFSFHATNVR